MQAVLAESAVQNESFQETSTVLRHPVARPPYESLSVRGLEILKVLNEVFNDLPPEAAVERNVRDQNRN